MRLTAPITVSGGEIKLSNWYFSTVGYQPPHYPRALTYDDTFIYSDAQGLLLPRRNVTDQGLLKGVWKSFDILCQNHDMYDPPPQRYRGLVIYQRLKTLASIAGLTFELLETQTGTRYTVMFGADGLTPQFMFQPNAREPDGFGRLVDMGPEYRVTVSLIEV